MGWVDEWWWISSKQRVFRGDFPFDMKIFFEFMGFCVQSMEDIKDIVFQQLGAIFNYPGGYPSKHIL